MRELEKSNAQKGYFYDIYETKNSSHLRTLYLLGSYKGIPIYYKRFISQMAKLKYRVVYLQPCPEVLSSRHPNWLGEAINQAVAVIRDDMKDNPSKNTYLMGISLGSYLGLNIQLRIPFKKFVVVAGGAPLNGVFRSVLMFWGDRRRLKKEASGYENLEAHWLPYDEAYKAADLSGTSTLFVNSKNDRVIPDKKFAKFLKEYKKTGVKIVNRQRGYLTHSLKVLSVNFRAKEVDDFFKSS